jgi:protein SCO1
MGSKIILFACCLLGLYTIACSKTQNPSSSSQTPVESSNKRYSLKGTVVSIDKQAKMLNVDSEAIAGFMDAMTMPYQVRPESELDRLRPGDAITADLIIQNDNAFLENIVVQGHAPSPKGK